MGMMRHPRTTQERRANGRRPHNGIDCDGYKVRVRAKRGGTFTLPSSYDDIWRSDLHDRSWKRHRKNKHKGS